MGWAFAGNLVYQACQWLNLVIMAKLLSVEEVGKFALALAISTPVTTSAALNLRNVQVTDTRDEFKFGHFLGAQLTTAVIAIVAVALITVNVSSDPDAVWITLLVCLGQITVTTRGVFIAFNQKHERMDTVALSTAIMGLCSLFVLGLTLYTTRNLIFGVIAMQMAKIVVLMGWDIGATSRLVRQYTSQEPSTFLWPNFNARRVLSLIWIALPLGITGVLLSLYNNIPIYFIAQYLGKESLGYFVPIMALVMAGTMLTRAAGSSALPRLSNYYLHDIHAYLKLLGKLISLGLVLGVVGAIIVLTFGKHLLHIAFTSDYVEYHALFTWAMMFGMIAYVVTFLGYGMTAMRKFAIQPIANLGAVIVTFGSAFFFIPQYDLLGAVWSLIAGKLTQGVLAAFVIWYGTRRHSLQESSSAQS